MAILNVLIMLKNMKEWVKLLMIIIVKFGFPVFKVLVKHFFDLWEKEKRTFMFIFRTSGLLLVNEFLFIFLLVADKYGELYLWQVNCMEISLVLVLTLLNDSLHNFFFVLLLGYKVQLQQRRKVFTCWGKRLCETWFKSYVKNAERRKSRKIELA